jgi:nitrate/nitrite transporter NarK
VLVAVQVASTLGRMVAGWIADRIGSARIVLVWMSWLMLALSIGFFWLSPQWPLWFVYAMFAAIGLASGAWAGILMAEAGQTALPGRVAAVIGSTLLYVNMGKFTGPAVFSAVYALTHSYNIAFALLAVPSLVAIACLRARQETVQGPGPGPRPAA